MIERGPAFGFGLMLAILLAACEPAADPPADATADPVPPAPRTEDSPLMPVDHSDITGTVSVDRNSDGITARLDLDGLSPGATYIVTIHEGRCAEDGPDRVPLGLIEGAEDGSAEARLRAAQDELPTGNWSVQVSSEAGETLACADVDAR